MADSKKPIIVHNGFLDLMHVPSQLFRSIIVSMDLFPKNGTATKRVSITYSLTFMITNISSISLLHSEVLLTINSLVLSIASLA